jgi:hypothetical protein
MASAHTHDPRVDLLGPVQVWHAHWTASMGQPVFAQTRTTARARQWPLAALAAFWTAVLLRAPQSLPHAWEAAATRPGAGWPAVPARPEAGCERCQSLPWRVCAPRDAAVVDPGWPDARPCAAPPVQGAFGDSDVPPVTPLESAGEPHFILPHEESPLGAAAVIACEEVRASKPWATVRHQRPECFAHWRATLETPGHEPPSTVPEVTATVWAVRQQRTGSRTAALVAPVQRGAHDRPQVPVRGVLGCCRPAGASAARPQPWGGRCRLSGRLFMVGRAGRACPPATTRWGGWQGGNRARGHRRRRSWSPQSRRTRPKRSCAR